jgi:hypothetical protein
MTALSVDLLEKFKTEHGFSLGELEHIYWLLEESDRRLYKALAIEEKAGREVSEELSEQIYWIAHELTEGAEKLELTITELKGTIR